MPGSQGFVSPIVTAKSSLGELFGAYGRMRIAGGPPSTIRRFVASAIGQTLILTLGGTANMLNLLGTPGLVISAPPRRQSANIAIERDSIVRIKIAGFVERLTVPSQKNSTASILGLNSSVGEQAATNDDVTMGPATEPEA
jgi:hypothetical protein